MPRFGLHLPSVGSADGIRATRLAFQQEGGAVAHLGYRRKEAPVPNRRGDEVLTRLEHGRKVKLLIAPVAKIAARGAVAGTMAVDEQNKAVIGADAYGIMGRNGCQRQRVPEVQHEGLAQRRRGMGDPGGVPVALRWVRRRAGLTRQGIQGDQEGAKRKQFAHRIRACLLPVKQLIR